MAQYKRLWKESIDKPQVFWAREAKELEWRTPWTKALDWKAPDAKWFVGGKLNVCENCVDRHPSGPRRLTVKKSTKKATSARSQTQLEGRRPEPTNRRLDAKKPIGRPPRSR